jgi:glycosyltransferase involved in cell wall biosynthesis
VPSNGGTVSAATNGWHLAVDEAHSISTAARGHVLVAIPAFDEDRFIGSLVLKLRARGHMVVVVDDGSSDATGDVAQAAGAVVLRHPQNLGKSAAVRTAFVHACRIAVDALVILDGDSQHDPADIDRLVEPILNGEADMVVGSRFAGMRSHIPRWRVAGQHALTLATNLGSGLHLTDSESGYRAFSRKALEEMRFSGTGFAIEPETQFEAKRRGWKVLEVPIRVHYELPLKRNPVWHGVGQVDAILRLIGQHRPLLFFSVPGLLLLLSGLYLGIQVARIYDATQQLAVGYALITVMLCIVGVLTTFTGIILHAMRALLTEHTGRD